VARLVRRSPTGAGPFAVIQADDYDAALAIARACPGDFAIEIREMAGYA